MLSEQLQGFNRGRIVLALVLATATAATAAERGIKEEQLIALERLTDGGRVAWQMRWDDERGTIHSLFGQKTAPLPSWSVDGPAAVERFFLSNAALFQLRPDIDELELTWDRERNGIRHLRFAQVFRGVPVEGGEYAVAVDRSGSIHMINGNLVPDLEVDTKPSVEPEAAEQRAIEAVENAEIDRGKPARLVIVDSKEGPRLIWQVTVRTASMRQYEVRVDAHWGEVIETHELSMHQIECPDDGFHGYVWPQDGTSPLTDVVLPSLTSYGSLNGQYMQVHNAEGQPDATSTDICGNFYYQPSNPHFTEVNTYYHLNKFLSYMVEAGFPGLNYKLVAIVNRTVPAYFYNQGTIYLWVGTTNPAGFQNGGRAAEVIAHEAQHAFTESYGITYAAGEPAALNEALSDYFASSYTNEPRVGEWFGPGPCRTTGVRSMTSDPAIYHYANFGQLDLICGGQIPNDPHPNSMILSGALWAIRGQLGSTLVDRLVLEALDYVPSTAVFWHLLDAMVQADIDHHGGANRTTIQTRFLERGITPNPTVSFTGQFAPKCATSATYTSSAGAVIPIAAYQWTMRPLSPPGGIWTFIGTGSTVTIPNMTADFELRLTALDAFNRPMQNTRTIDVVPEVSIDADPPTVSPFECATIAAVHPCPVSSYAWERRDFFPDVGIWGPWEPLDDATASIEQCAGESDFEVRVSVLALDGDLGQATQVVAVTGGGLVVSDTGDGPEWLVRDRATIELVLLAPGPVEIAVIDVKGRRVQSIYQGHMGAGSRRFEWRPDGLASGVYFYHVTASNRSRSQRFVLLH